jgi:hypothetical protein
VTWVIIIVILLVAFGPILWLRPSARDRRQSALRTQARKDGLQVEMRRYPKLDLRPEERVTSGGKVVDAQLEAAVYRAPLDPKLRNLPAWRVLRATDGLPAWPGWVFELGTRPEHPELRRMLAVLEPLVAGLKDDVVALECTPLALGAYWLERPGTVPADVTSLADWLRRAGARLTALDEELAEPAA